MAEEKDIPINPQKNPEQESAVHLKSGSSKTKTIRFSKDEQIYTTTGTLTG